ncbi:unnamed protein product, partial [Ascophyllum nodosum]
MKRLFGRAYTYGHFIGTYACGIIAGRTVLFGGEGQVMFYDNACRREAFLQNRSDPGWSTT